MDKRQQMPNIHLENEKEMPPQGPQFSEEMRAIMPDFQKWNAVFFRLDCIAVGCSFLLRCIFVFYYNYKGIIPKDEIGSYLLLNIVIPNLLNLLVLFLAVMIKRRLPKEDMRQNFIPIFVMLLFSFIISMTRCILFVTLSVFCVPICMTTVFSNKKMCRLITYISMAGVAIVTLKQYLTMEDATQRAWVIPQGLILIGILITMRMVAQTVLGMTEGQKKKLLDYAKNVKEAQYRAEAANKAKSLFLANMSHEIRTPINAILGMDEMILRENENEQIREYASSIHSASSSLLSLVNDVLDISKIESGKLEILENTYDTASFIHDCYNMIAKRAEKKNLELTVDCSPQLPIRLKGDEARIRQIITNLLSNAVKYTKKGSITLSVNSHEENGQFFFDVTVKDTGVGIKEENIDNLFLKFSRFDLEKNRNIEGTGLGLAITKQLIDLMHGEIQVQSIYGLGSSFTVKIPQQVVDKTPMGDFEKRYNDIDRENAAYQKSFEAPDARILIVDDVEVNLQVIVNLLKQTRIKVDTAKSGKKCLEMAVQKKYDLIFMDHMMPEMDGIETYKKMKALENSLNKDTSVIMLTANAVTGVKEQYLNAGFADYLSKPVRGDKLEKMILKYLPKDKINDAEDVPSKPNNATILQSLFQAYPKVNLSLGLSFCGQNSDVYISVLQTYVENSKAEELNSYYEQEDVQNYQVTVHGIKSASLNVGFSALSEDARALEDAAKEQNWDYIHEKHAAFMNEYQGVIAALQDAVKGR